MITPELPVRKISHDLPYQVILTQSAFHYKLEPKNQVIWTTRYKAMAKYISIYFDKFHKNWLALLGHKVHQKQKLFREYAMGYI